MQVYKKEEKSSYFETRKLQIFHLILNEAFKNVF